MLIRPPFRDVPVSKTLDDLKRPKHEIMPKVEGPSNSIAPLPRGRFLIPKGYVIFTEDIHDEAQINAYAQQAIPTILQAGGQVLVANDAPELIEGSWHGKRTVLLEFESVEAARNWYRSAEYQGLAGRRHAAADSNAVIVAGFEMPTG